MGNFSKHLEYSPYTYNLSNEKLYLKNIMTKMKILLEQFISIRNSSPHPPPPKKEKENREKNEYIRSQGGRKYSEQCTGGKKTQQNVFETCKTEGKCLTGLIRETVIEIVAQNVLDMPRYQVTDSRRSTSPTEYKQKENYTERLPS